MSHILQNFKATMLPNLFLSTLAGFVTFLYITLNSHLLPNAAQLGLIDEERILLDATYSFLAMFVVNTIMFLALAVAAAKMRKNSGSTAYRRMLWFVSGGVFVLQILLMVIGIVLYWDKIPGKALFDYVESFAAPLAYGSLLINFAVGFVVLKFSK